MKTLVLITSQFPYGTGESFVAAELPILVRNFEKVIIISQNISGEKTRITPENVVVHRYNTSTSIRGFLYMPILFILNSDTVINMLKEEIEFRLGMTHHLTIRMFFHLFKKIIKSLQLRDFINQKLKEEGVNESIIFYSYWLKTGAQAIALLKYRDSIKISRAHGSDIYEEKTESGYLPLLKFTALNLDAIFFVSRQGVRYFEEKVKPGNLHLLVSYLGTEKPDSKNIKLEKSDKFVIVSCSNMIALKRIDLIIDSLEVIKTAKDIQWLHFGDGILKNELEIHAGKKLGQLKNISYRFMGHYPNEELLNYYSGHHVDLFLNTSSTEGVPVSIMEAQSFGIPVIATDTGGIKELVREGTGSLLPPDFRNEDLAELIQFYINMKSEEVEVIRINSFNNWKSNFNAQLNYEDFIMKLNSILASSKVPTQH